MLCSLRLASRRRPPQQPRQVGEVHRHPPRLVAGQPVGGRAAMWLIVEIAERSAVRVVIQYSASEVALVGTSIRVHGDFRIWRFLPHSRENAELRSLYAECDQKSSVRNPQSATLTSSTDHSEVFSQNNLPSHTACAIIIGSRCWTGDFWTIAPTAGISCSARVTHRLNLLRPATGRINNGDSPSACP